MFRKTNPDRVFSITHFLPKKKKIENKYGQKNQKVVKWKNYNCC